METEPTGRALKPAVAAPRGARLRVVEQRSLVDPAAWDALVDQAPLPSGFLKTWWLDAVADQHARYVLVMDGEQLIGGVALQRRRYGGVPRYEVLGGGRLCPDHLDLVALPDRVGTVVQALRCWFTRPGSRIVDLDGLHEHARILQALPEHREVERATAWWEPLAQDSADFYAARSSSFARRIRKRRRRLEAAGIQFRRLDASEIPMAMSAFRDLHAVRADRQPLLRRYDVIRRAFLAGAAVDEVRIDAAELDGEVCGLLLSITTGNRLATYQIARRLEPEFSDIGTFLYVTALESAGAAGLTELDMLRGDETYKHSFAAHQRSLLRVWAGYGRFGGLMLRMAGLHRRTRHRVGALLCSLRGSGVAQ